MAEVFTRYLQEAFFSTESSTVLGLLKEEVGPLPAACISPESGTRGFAIGPMSAQLLSFSPGAGLASLVLTGSSIQKCKVDARWVVSDSAGSDFTIIEIESPQLSGKAFVWSRRMIASNKEVSTSSGRPWMRGIILGVGLAESGREWTLAVRVQDRQLLGSPIVHEISRRAKGEVDVRYTGAVRSLAAKKSTRRSGHWYRGRLRPLEIGTSVAHKDVTAGTIGAFVRKGRDGSWYVLSNNHVLANVNEARLGDEILQPGPADGGHLNKHDIVAHLKKFVPISFSVPNAVDCAIAKVAGGVDCLPDWISGFGQFRGMREDDVEILMEVHKLGRTTGKTRGRISAVALDDVAVDMDTGTAMFDDQIEIESIHPTKPFCLGGDSGSLILDGDNRAVALLFAGSEAGGAGDLGLTFANPIKTVTKALGIRFEV